MANFAVIDNNIVVNVIVCDNLETAKTITGKLCVEVDYGYIGATYDGTKFTIPEPEPSEPPVINS